MQKGSALFILSVILRSGFISASCDDDAGQVEKRRIHFDVVVVANQQCASEVSQPGEKSADPPAFAITTQCA